MYLGDTHFRLRQFGHENNRSSASFVRHPITVQGQLEETSTIDKCLTYKHHNVLVFLPKDSAQSFLQRTR